ncbi:unnamed protein product [Angiostrongylus costaricensis]|uniref:Delta-like protein n=1 Tax=Angiostrongylus costaricensis TaxID=334426 RepID=A0A0R3PA95_ANGCS|nr:unnamed protein product [Angiostrongylus costaricensis]
MWPFTMSIPRQQENQFVVVNVGSELDLLSSNTSKEKFTIGSEFIPAEGSSDFLDIAFRSSCQPSYYGSGCQRYCKASFSYTCDANGKRICLTGWFGEQCDQHLEYCSRHKPCKNGGVCTNGGLTTDFTCQCPEAFVGVTCEIELPSICQHQGICRNAIFHKNNQSLESAVHCIGGICTNIDTKLGRCLCVKGFEGKYCERRIVQTHCTQNTCKNGGSCQGESVCVCPLCFSGYDCSVIDKECLWNRANVSLVTKNGFNEDEQDVPTRILMFMAFISIMMLASCVVVFFFKYTKMKRLLHDPITQNTLNERRQIHIDLPKQSIDKRSYSDDSYKVFVIPSKRHTKTDVEKSCDGVDYESKRYVTQLRGRYCTLPCMDVVVAEPEHQYAEIEYRPTTVSLDDKQFTENACVV